MRRLHLQFGVKHLLFLCVVVAVLIAWVTHQARVQRQAVDAILRVGGIVTYDEPTGKIGSLLVRWFGIDMICNVAQVSIDAGEDVSNEGLNSLELLPHVKSLWIRGRNLDSSTLEIVCRLRNLEDLSLGMPLIDEDLDSLNTLQELKSVFFIGLGTWSQVYRMQSNTERVFDTDDYETELSRERMKKFALEHPSCKIISY